MIAKYFLSYFGVNILALGWIFLHSSRALSLDSGVSTTLAQLFLSYHSNPAGHAGFTQTNLAVPEHPTGSSW